MKEFFALVLYVVMILSLTIPCSAAEGAESDWSGMNVSTVNPMENLVPYGTEYPTETYYPHDEGTLSFQGEASYSMLLLNKMVLGCSQYIIEITNQSNTPLSCTIRRQNSGDVSKTVPANSTRTYVIGAASDEIVCISFNAPSNFKGSIGCDCPGAK